jgi:hypothetical protein
MKNKYTYPANMPANEWLAENGICIAQLIKAENELLKAKKIAQFLLNYAAKLLEPKEQLVLTQFLKAMCVFNSRRKLSSRHAYKIIEISKAIIRKLSKPITKSQIEIQQQ